VKNKIHQVASQQVITEQKRRYSIPTTISRARRPATVNQHLRQYFNAASKALGTQASTYSDLISSFNPLPYAQAGETSTRARYAPHSDRNYNTLRDGSQVRRREQRPVKSENLANLPIQKSNFQDFDGQSPKNGRSVAATGSQKTNSTTSSTRTNSIRGGSERASAPSQNPLSAKREQAERLLKNYLDRLNESHVFNWLEKKFNDELGAHYRDGSVSIGNPNNPIKINPDDIRTR
jgi:hypothetical protein